MSAHPTARAMAEQAYQPRDGASADELSSMHHARAHHAGGIREERARMAKHLRERAVALRTAHAEAIEAAGECSGTGAWGVTGAKGGMRAMLGRALLDVLAAIDAEADALESK